MHEVDKTGEEFSLYVHIPFCVRKCPYCDFNSYATDKSQLPEKEYTDALIHELRFYTQELSLSSRTCRSIFFGGGTPSLFSGPSIEQILQTAQSFFPFDPEIEITLEANPGTIDEDLDCDRLSHYKSSGVNRISLGVQSFSPRKLQLLGRAHDVNETLSAVENIRRSGFTNFNLDLISGTTGETSQELLSDLVQLCALKPNHVSVYLLTIEPGTDFGRRAKRGEKLTALDGVQAELYEQTTNYLQERGILRYEISNYAKLGSECVHNLGYWTGREYLGLGAGAHSYFRNYAPATLSESHATWGLRWSNLPGPRQYIERIAQRFEAQQNHDSLNEEKAQLEFLLLGLRRREGISLQRFQALFHKDFTKQHGASLQKLVEQNLITLEPDRVTLTSNGFLQADAIFSQLT